MAQMKKAAVSGKTVKTTTYSLLKPFQKDVKMVNERTTRKPVAKTTTKAPAKKPAGKPVGKLVGPAAVEALQKRVSPAGVKKAEMDAKKAIAKKYPGLTKKSK
jgi:hypothetical protein